MIKNISTIILSTIPLFTYAKDYGCATVGASMESVLFDKLSTDLKIDTSTVDEKKTKVEILNISAISKMYAAHLARIDYNKDPDKDKTEDTYNNIYFSSYYENDVKTITAQYTYIDYKGNKDLFIATSLMNKEECSIRFNGYLTLSREF